MITIIKSVVFYLLRYTQNGSIIGSRSFTFLMSLLHLTSPARKRETPLSEISPTLIQTNPYNTRLWPFRVSDIVA